MLDISECVNKPAVRLPSKMQRIISITSIFFTDFEENCCSERLVTSMFVQLFFYNYLQSG